MSHSSIHTDAEKHQDHSTPIQQRSTMSPTLTALRVAQYAVSITALVVASCALDRSLTSNAWFSDEASVIAGSVIALIRLPIAIHPSFHRTATSTYADGITALLLLAALITSATFQAKSMGSCEGPAFIGVFDNKRACRKMTGAVVLAGIDFALFAASGVIGLGKGRKY